MLIDTNPVRVRLGFKIQWIDPKFPAETSIIRTTSKRFQTEICVKLRPSVYEHAVV